AGGADGRDRGRIYFEGSGVRSAGIDPCGDAGDRFTRKLLALVRHAWFQFMVDPFPKRAVLRLAGDNGRSVVASTQQRFAIRQIESGPVRLVTAVAWQTFGFK